MNPTHSDKLFKLFFNAAGIMVAVALAAAAYYWFAVIRLGEFAMKDYYSFLQGIEMENRGIGAKTGPILLDRMSASGFRVIGLESHDKKFPRTWIILNKTAPDGTVLMLPVGTGVQVPCRYIEDLRAKELSDPKVIQFLEGICTK